MSAFVETMFSVGQVPWHGEGNIIPKDKKLSIQEGLKEAGLDWNVKLVGLVTLNKAQEAIYYTHGSLEKNEDPPEIKSNVNHRAVVRETDGSILGVVKSKYRPLQNIQAFEFFQPFLDANTCSLHTAGSLYQGSKTWVLAELNNTPSVVVPGDEISKFILLSNSHDGSSAVKVGFTPIRVVCANTLNMAHHSSVSKLIRVRHTKSVKINLDAIRETMNLANQEFEATAKQYQYLASRQINVGDLRKYVKIILEVDNVDDNDLKTRTKNKIDQIIGLCESGIGNTNPQVRNTYWSAYNGITEYLNHHASRNVNNRLNNLWFNSNVGQRALDLALEMAG